MQRQIGRVGRTLFETFTDWRCAVSRLTIVALCLLWIPDAAASTVPREFLAWHLRGISTVCYEQRAEIWRFTPRRADDEAQRTPRAVRVIGSLETRGRLLLGRSIQAIPQIKFAECSTQMALDDSVLKVSLTAQVELGLNRPGQPLSGTNIPGVATVALTLSRYTWSSIHTAAVKPRAIILSDDEAVLSARLNDALDALVTELTTALVDAARYGN